MTQPSPSCGCGTHDIRETFRWPSATCYDARDAQAAGLRLADAIDHCRDVLPTSDLNYLLWAAEIACKQLRDAAETIENMHCIIQDLQESALLNRQKKSRKKTS